jgi:hypothetical protein
MHVGQNHALGMNEISFHLFDDENSDATYNGPRTLKIYPISFHMSVNTDGFPFICESGELTLSYFQQIAATHQIPEGNDKLCCVGEWKIFSKKKNSRLPSLQTSRRRIFFPLWDSL